MQLIETLQKLGVPSLVILLTLALLRLLPAMTRNLAAKTRQTEKLTETVPRIEDHLSKMASHGQASEHLLREIRDTQKEHSGKLDRILGRRP